VIRYGLRRLSQSRNRVSRPESTHFDAPPPGFFQALDAVGSEDQIEIERAVLQLDEILAAADLRRLFVRQIEPQVTDSYQPLAMGFVSRISPACL